MTTDARFRINSNYTEFAECDTLAEAKRVAVAESYKYDDTVTIYDRGQVKYMATHGALYRVTAAR